MGFHVELLGLGRNALQMLTACGVTFRNNGGEFSTIQGELACSVVLIRYDDTGGIL